MSKGSRSHVETKIICLGIESTAHTFSVGLVREDGEILAMKSSVYVPQVGGIHPREAAQHHSKHAPKVIGEALKAAGITIDDVDVIAYSMGPGLGPCLRTGATIARALASYYNKPLVPINHCVAHIEIGRLLTGAEDPLVVYVSGGNTIVSAFSGGKYRVFGETLDIALGNCLDVFAREAGIAPPYIIGDLHVIDYYAQKGKNIIDLPYIVKGQDLSFSGLLTAALKRLRENVDINDLCLSFRETAYNMVVEVAERALAYTGKSELLLTGGVAASPILQSKLSLMASEHKARFYVTPSKYAGDNGVMIAWNGILAFKHGITVNIEHARVKQRWRLDEVEVPWRL